MVRQLVASEAIARVFHLYATYWKPLIGAALIVFSLELLATLLGLGLFVSLLSLVLSTLFQGMVVVLVLDVRDGRLDSSLGDLLRSVLPVLGPLILVGLISGLGIGIGLILLIVPGLILLTLWAVAAPVTVIERPGVLPAFSRSRELVRGHGWPVFAVIVTMFLLVAAVSFGAGIATLALGDVGSAIVLWLAVSLIMPLNALAAPVIYFALLDARGAPVPHAAAAA